MHAAAADAKAIVRGWETVENMSGSIMDAMSEAVEGAELILYGVSEK